MVAEFDADLIRDKANPQDKLDSHGTRVAGVIWANHEGHLKGLAPQAELIAIRQVVGQTSAVLRAFEFARKHNADIINASWNSQLLLQPIADVVNDFAEHGRGGKGAIVVFSAGNDGKSIGPSTSEASIEQAVVVGASNKAGKRLAKSNYGQTVDFSLFGGGIRSTTLNGGYQLLAGTSLSAAMASGLFALFIERNPDATAIELQNQFKSWLAEGV